MQRTTSSHCGGGLPLQQQATYSTAGKLAWQTHCGCGWGGFSSNGEFPVFSPSIRILLPKIDSMCLRRPSRDLVAPRLLPLLVIDAPVQCNKIVLMERWVCGLCVLVIRLLGVYHIFPPLLVCSAWGIGFSLCSSWQLLDSAFCTAFLFSTVVAKLDRSGYEFCPMRHLSCGVLKSCLKSCLPKVNCAGNEDLKGLFHTTHKAWVHK